MSDICANLPQQFDFKVRAHSEQTATEGGGK